MASDGDGEWAMPVAHDVLQDMADKGVLAQSTSVFGECEYTVAPSASLWVAAYEVHQGDRDALAHLSGKPLLTWGKLDMMLMLARRGWTPAALQHGDYYELDGEKLYQLDPTKPKLYFAALLDSAAIVARLPATEMQLPCIYHGFPAAYYQVLLTVTDPSKLQAMLALLDEVGARGAATSNKFQMLLGEGPHSLDEELPPQPRAALMPLPPLDHEAVLATHKVAWQVVRAIPEKMVDITEQWRVKVGSTLVSVKLDNASHASGHQRMYVACACAAHRPCFKYAVVHQFPSVRRGVAMLAAWATEPSTRPKDWSKAEHLAFAPAADVVDRLEADAEVE